MLYPENRKDLIDLQEQGRLLKKLHPTATPNTTTPRNIF